MKKIIKKYGKKILMDAIIGTILSMIVIYLIIGPFNERFVSLLHEISEGNLVLTTCLIMLPAVFIVCLITSFASRIDVKKK